MKALGLIVLALFWLAVLQGLARFLALLTLAMLLWAVCFRPREVATTLVVLTVCSLILVHPGWFAVLLALALCAKRLEQKGR
jgi:hypothetical protein